MAGLLIVIFVAGIVWGLTSFTFPAPEKPIIYLYPTDTTEVSVELSHPELLTAHYPPYNERWSVVAEPNGDLTELGTGRELYALYYECESLSGYGRTGEGFVIARDDTVSFLETTLPTLGLNPHEAQEFIIYWLPKLQENPYNYIRFASLAEQNANMMLTITPTPDTLIRVLMLYQGLDAPISVTPQEIHTPVRNGFVVVEWGGAHIG